MSQTNQRPRPWQTATWFFIAANFILVLPNFSGSIYVPYDERIAVPVSVALLLAGALILLLKPKWAVRTEPATAQEGGVGA